MKAKYTPLLFILLPFLGTAQLRTGTAVLYIGSNTSVITTGTVTLAGNIAGTGNVTMAGNTLQDVNAAGFAIPNLVINNAANVRMTGDAIVADSLKFIKGKVYTNNFLFSILPAAKITGYGNTAYVATSDATNNVATTGGLKITVAAGTQILFPAGPNSNSYNPLTIKNNAGPDEQYTLRVSPVAVAGPTAANTVNITWNVTEATAGGNTLVLTPQWNGADEPAGFNRASARMVRSNGTTDVEKTGISAATGAGPYRISAGPFTGASLFGVTSAANALMATTIANPSDAIAAIESIKMYPTIVPGNTAQLLINTPAQKKYLYIITDMNGKTFARKDLPLWKGNNIIPVTLPALAGGMYILNVYDGTVLKKSIKFVKG